MSPLVHTTGRPVPVSNGPLRPLRHPKETCKDVSLEEDAGIQLMLDILAESSQPLTISVTGAELDADGKAQ
jgi:hypothetical protein